MCFGSREKGDGGLARSRDIDKQLRQDEKKMAKEVKLLLLGMCIPGPRACSRRKHHTRPLAGRDDGKVFAQHMDKRPLRLTRAA